MGNNPNFSQRAQGSRVEPINQRPHGPCFNWADNVGSVDFITLSSKGGPPTPDNYLFTVDSPYEVQILLFCQDFPVTCRPFTFYDLATDPPLLNQSYPEHPPVMEARHFALNGNGLYSTSQASPVRYKCGTYGNTLTEQIYTSGYALSLYLIDRGLVNVGKPLEPRLQMDFTTNGAVTSGKGRYFDFTEENGIELEIRPVILLEAVYTEAMARNNNIYTVGTTRCLICGLFTEQGATR